MPAIGTVDAPGTFTPGPTAQGANLNPYVDPGPWGFVEIGGYRLLGVVRSIDGAEKPEEWNYAKGTASSGATSTWKGTKLAESIKIALEAPSFASFEGLYTLRDTLRPKIGNKPPALTITNAIINFNGITRVASVNIGQPKPVAGLSWQIEIILSEFNPPKPANVGTNTGAVTGKKKSANDLLAEELQKAMNAALDA